MWLLSTLFLAVSGQGYGQPYNVDFLLSRFSNPDPDVRGSVAEALGETRDSRAVESLIAAMLHDPDLLVRMRSATALGTIRDPRAVQPLLESMKDPQNYNYVINPIRWADALAEIGIPSVSPLIATLNNDYSSAPGDASVHHAIREGAAVALSKIKDRCAFDTLLHALRV
jgi:HEAT repeat protein